MTTRILCLGGEAPLETGGLSTLGRIKLLDRGGSHGGDTAHSSHVCILPSFSLNDLSCCRRVLYTFNQMIDFIILVT